MAQELDLQPLSTTDGLDIQPLENSGGLDLQPLTTDEPAEPEKRQPHSINPFADILAKTAISLRKAWEEDKKNQPIFVDGAWLDPTTGKVTMDKPLNDFEKVVAGAAYGDPTAIGSIVTESLYTLEPTQTARAIRQALLARKAAQKNTKAMEEAHTALDEMNEAVVREMAKGQTHHEAVLAAERRIGRTFDEVQELQYMTGRRVEVPKDMDEALAIVNASSDANVLTKESGLLTDLFKITSTRVKELSEEVFGQLRKFELGWRTKLHGYREEVKPFMKDIEGLGKIEKRTVKRALLSGDFDQVERVFKAVGIGTNNLKKYRTTMDKVFDDLTKARYKPERVINYFPRVLKDSKKFLKSLGHREQSLAVKAIAAKAKHLKKNVTDLTEEERTAAISKALFGSRKTSTALGATKSRVYREIPDKILDEYADPIHALESYLRRTVMDTSKRIFLGKNLKMVPGKGIDYENSLGSYLRGHKIVEQAPEFAELRKLLRTRFMEGEVSPGKLIQTTRNITYTGTIANPFSAITQLQDVGIAMKRFGITNVLKSIVGKRHAKAVDFGITDAAEELTHSPSMTAKVMEKMLKVSGFNKMDRFGKNLILNSSLKRNQKLIKTSKGRAEFEKKWGKVFGKETVNVIDDLRSGKMTGNVKLLLWNELSDIQPVSLLEMPLKYLQSPNGRIFYALKTFTIRQIDTILNDTVRMMKRGEVIKGTKNLTQYIVLLGAAGVATDTIKDVLMGKEIKPEKVPDKAIANMLKIFAASEFITSKAKTGSVGTAIADLAEPAALGLLDSVGNDVKEVLEDGKTDASSLKHFPVIGKLWYYWMGPGLDKIAKEEKSK